MNTKLNVYFTNHSLDLFNKSKTLEDFIIWKENDLKKENKELNYIILENPIFNPLYIEKIKNTLENICPEHYVIYNKNICSVNGCKNKYKKIKIYEDKLNKEIVFIDNFNKIYNAKKVLQIFSNIDRKIIEKMHFLKFKDIKVNNDPTKLLMEYIPVLPKYIRPDSFINNNESEDKITTFYKNIFKYNKMKDFSKIYEEYKKIIIKNEKETDKYKTIIKRISSKKGLFRNNILGKRTRLCGRSVITPDIFLKIDEIGVPYEMANKLTFKNRNLRNNDYVLFIRHPTLQKMSVMSMKVKIQKNTYTIKMNPALCPAYNADFDGDEMNIFCVNEIKSIVEAKYINSPLYSIISPQNNKPVIYPSQDCITGLYILTYQNIEIDKNIFYNCLCIVKKNINHLNINFNSRYLFSLCLPDNFNFYEENVIIEDSLLIKGCINKNIILKIIKNMTYNYDNNIIIEFIYNLQLIINEWLNSYNLSISYDDVFIPYLYKNKNDKNKVNKKLLLIINNNNMFNYIINSGSKGSFTNLRQILLFVGQQYIKNRKIVNINFLNNINSFCYNSYVEGLSNYEYFYHCQSAREGIISTNIKTPNIGYIQRKLTKFLENIVIQYDRYIIFNDYIIN